VASAFQSNAFQEQDDAFQIDNPFQDGALSATGTGTATFVGASTSAQPFSMTGTGTASFVGASTAVAALSATGTGTATFVGVADFLAALSATGTFNGPPVTNLVVRSQELDNASWTTTRSSITADTTTAPDATLTAEKLVEDGSVTTTHYVRSAEATVAASTTYTASIYVKAAERTAVGFGYFGTGAAKGIYLHADLATGVLNTGGTGEFGGASKTSETIADVGGGWYRLTLTGSVSTDVTALLHLALQNPVQTNDYTGDGTSGAYAWGAQIEIGAVASEYIPTTSAAVTVNRPFVGASQADSALSATGTGTATFVGLAIQSAAPFSMTGTGTATFVGAPFASGVLSATGTGTATFDGLAINTVAPFAMTGTGTATFVGAATADGLLSATGTGTASFVGVSTAAAALSATGTATVSLVGASFSNGVLSIVGTGTALFGFANDGDGAISATGTGTALLAGASDADAALSATGTANVDFVGEGVAGATDAVLDATGTGTATFVGAFDAAAQPEAPATAGGAGAPGAWRDHYKGRKRRKKDALEELDELLVDLRGQIVPWQKAKAYQAEQALYRETLARGEALDASDTLQRIETEIVNLKELLAEIDEEEAVMLLLM
jgi:hypothetical protein